MKPFPLLAIAPRKFNTGKDNAQINTIVNEAPPTAPYVFTSYVFKGFVDSANSYGAVGGASLTIVFIWALSFPVLNFLGAMARRGNGFMLNYLTVHASTNAIKKLFEYLSLHSLSYFNDRFSGALSERTGATSAGVSRSIYQFNTIILDLFISIVGTSILFFSS